MWPENGWLLCFVGGWGVGTTCPIKKGEEKRDGGFSEAWLLSFDYSWPTNLDIMHHAVLVRPFPTNNYLRNFGLARIFPLDWI